MLTNEERDRIQKVSEQLHFCAERLYDLSRHEAEFDSWVKTGLENNSSSLFNRAADLSKIRLTIAKRMEEEAKPYRGARTGDYLGGVPYGEYSQHVVVQREDGSWPSRPDVDEPVLYQYGLNYHNHSKLPPIEPTDEPVWAKLDERLTKVEEQLKTGVDQDDPRPERPAEPWDHVQVNTGENIVVEGNYIIDPQNWGEHACGNGYVLAKINGFQNVKVKCLRLENHEGSHANGQLTWPGLNVVRCNASFTGMEHDKPVVYSCHLARGHLSSHTNGQFYWDVIAGLRKRDSDD